MPKHLFFYWANDEIWTRGLFLTKEALYPWATPALKESGRRDSNSRRSAWKADALPTELLPHILPSWGEQDSNLRRCTPTDLQSVLVSHLSISPTLRADGGIRTPDQLITNQLLWPTELHRRMSVPINKEQSLQNLDCKCMKLFLIEKIFMDFFNCQLN